MNPHTFHISLYDLALTSLIAGLTLALLLGFAKRDNQKANLFLSLALAVMVLKTGGLTSLLLPALGPLLYFYVRQLTNPDRRFSLKDTLHFSLLPVGYWMPAWLVLISIIAYLCLSHRLIEDFYHKLRPVLMDRPRFAFRRLDTALLLLGLFCVLSLFNDTFYLGIALVLIGMAVEAILKPGSGDVQLTMPITDRSDAREKGRRLKEAVAVNRLYEDAELTLATLAVKLMLHPHDLSRIINVGLEKNFSDFINEFRVREVARKIQDPAYDRFTLPGIAYESGFNSKTTFNRVFKEMTGKTPLEYKNSLNKSVPIDKLVHLQHIHPVILRSESPPNWAAGKLNRNVMVRNYFKTAFRVFSRRKLFTFINVVGLSIGTSAALVIYLIVHHDFTFDKFHKDGDRIYRVATDLSFQGQPLFTGGTTISLTNAIKDETTGSEDSAPLLMLGKVDATIPDGSKAPVKFRKQAEATLADAHYFNIFQYKWLAGSAQNSLNNPYQTVLTSDAAKKYFPSLSYDQMLGKQIIYQDSLRTTVTGVVESIDENTDLTFTDFISYATGKSDRKLKDQMHDAWDAISSFSMLFVKLSPGTTPIKFEAQINALLKKNNPPALREKGNTQSFHLQALSDIHFDGKYGGIENPTANKNTLYGLVVIAAFLLLLASINFINLTTAQASQRAKEIGIRKTMGGTRFQLIGQFLSETFLVTLFAVGISISLVPFILQLFSEFISKDISTVLLFQPGPVIFIVLLIVGVSMLSGFYPAMVLSNYRPVSALKNEAQPIGNNVRKAWLRKSLTVTQFIVAQFFIMATLIVSKQIYYALHKDLGYKKDAIVFVVTPFFEHNSFTQKQVFFNKLKTIPQIELISQGEFPPSSDGTRSSNISYLDGKKETKARVALKFIDENYLKVYHIKLFAGRTLTAGDTNNRTIINMTLAKTFGFRNPQDAVGKFIHWDQRKTEIVGVTGDFYQESLHDAIKPLAMVYHSNTFNNNIFHIALKPKTDSGDEWKTAIASIGKIWKEIYPGDDFNYQFYDDSIAKFYESDEHTSKLLNWATGLAVLISCLGLLGLVMYNANSRIKEIGVRKVLGASVQQIVVLLSRELVILVVAAFAIVTPLAWWIMHKWIENFADRTPISWWIFALSGIGMLLATLFTLSFQTIKAALANPVRSLRSE